MHWLSNNGDGDIDNLQVHVSGTAGQWCMAGLQAAHASAALPLVSSWQLLA